MSFHYAHESTKTYGHDVGLSAVFRQWRADSHCNKLHGYALAVKLVFKAETLDSRNWVVDFGALKPVKAFLQQSFDHTVLIAADDPQRPVFEDLDQRGLIDLRVLPAVGCEAFASWIAQYVKGWLRTEYMPSLADNKIQAPIGLHIAEVEVREHGANGASWFA